MMDKRICRGCGQTKLRRFYETTRFGQKLYVDDGGRLWRGNYCCQCNSKRVNDKQKKKNALKKDKVDEECVTIQPSPKRKCRRCGDTLPTTRYFYHERCAPGQMNETEIHPGLIW